MSTSRTLTNRSNFDLTCIAAGGIGSYSAGRHTKFQFLFKFSTKISYFKLSNSALPVNRAIEEAMMVDVRPLPTVCAIRPGLA